MSWVGVVVFFWSGFYSNPPAFVYVELSLKWLYHDQESEQHRCWSDCGCECWSALLLSAYGKIGSLAKGLLKGLNFLDMMLNNELISMHVVAFYVHGHVIRSNVLSYLSSDSALSYCNICRKPRLVLLLGLSAPPSQLHCPNFTETENY